MRRLLEKSRTEEHRGEAYDETQVPEPPGKIQRMGMGIIVMFGCGIWTYVALRDVSVQDQLPG